MVATIAQGSGRYMDIHSVDPSAQLLHSNELNCKHCCILSGHNFRFSLPFDGRFSLAFSSSVVVVVAVVVVGLFYSRHIFIVVISFYGYLLY